MIRTKIVATMGPACSSPEILYSLFEAGVDVCRLNFSHGSLDEHLLMLRNIREAAALEAADRGARRLVRAEDSGR